jgi:hypothetical protein
MAGEPDRAIEQADISLCLSPRTCSGPVHTMIGASHLVGRRFDEAIAKLLLALEVSPNSPVAFRYLADCCARLGWLDEARNDYCWSRRADSLGMLGVSMPIRAQRVATPLHPIRQDVSATGFSSIAKW